MKNLTLAAMGRIKAIHELSRRYNQTLVKSHQEKLLELIDKHVLEIRGLFADNSPHAVVETGDLAVLCFELILEAGQSPDEILEKCFGRYEKKLAELMGE